LYISSSRKRLKSFDFPFLFEPLYFPTLAFEFPLLSLHFSFGLLLLNFLILHGVSNYRAADCAQAATDSGACAWSAHGSSDDRTRSSAQATAEQGTFLSGREGLTGAARQANQHYDCNDSRRTRFSQHVQVALPRNFRNASRPCA
jgi:hypothetical protein